MGEQLGRAWGVVGHLHGVNDVPAWREAYNASLPEITRFYSSLGQNLALFAKYRALHDSPEYASLSPARQRILDNEVRDFRLSGAELPEEQKPRFKEIQEELASLSAKFSENVLDATNAFAEYVTDEALLAGLPDDSIEAARDAAQRDDREGWKFTLHMPSYLPVMQYADNRDLRARMYRASATRASEFGDAVRDNTPLIDRILSLRAEESKMLGFDSFAELSMVPKMADNPTQVMAFLRDLGIRARPHGQRDLDELRAFARNEFGLDELQSWDMTWVSEKLRSHRYNFSEHEVKLYFPEPKVLEGLFRVIEGLYGVTIKPDTAPVWHPDVRFFRIERTGAQGANSWASSTSTCTHATPSAVAPGWTKPSPAAVSARRADPGRLPELQLPVAGRRKGRQTQARHLHARRRDHAVPRIRPRPASPADPGR
jgi:oligopeptidase A